MLNSLDDTCFAFLNLAYKSKLDINFYRWKLHRAQLYQILPLKHIRFLKFLTFQLVPHFCFLIFVEKKLQRVLKDLKILKCNEKEAGCTFFGGNFHGILQCLNFK